MSWKNKLFGGISRPRKEKGSFPVHIELVPQSLIAKVYLHEIETHRNPLLVWSYITDGLKTHNQKEVIFTLLRKPNERPEAFLRDPLELFIVINELAEQGRLVDIGSVTQFGENKFLHRHLAYIQPQSFPGVAVPDPAIHAILVSEDEVVAIQEFGITRVIARLGLESQYFPCPPWSDRSRPGISFVQTRKESILALTIRVYASGIRVVQEDQQIIVRLPASKSEWIKKLLTETPTTAPLALLTDLDPRADGCLVWEPGQSQPAAITAPDSDGSCLSGCFVLFVPDQNSR